MSSFASPIGHSRPLTDVAIKATALVPRHLDYPSFPAWGLLARAARECPDRIACHYYERRWTYAEMQRDAAKACALFRSLGVKPGDRVGILLPNVPEYQIALNGIWLAGGIAVAISPLSVAEEVSRLLESTQCRVVVSLDILTPLLEQSEFRPEQTLLVSVREHLPVWQQAGYLWARWQRTGHWRFAENGHAHWFATSLEQMEPDLEPAPVDPARDAAYILPTGGTTGAPKAVTLSHRNLVANAWQQYHWAGGRMGEETLLAVLPFFHSYGLSTLLLGGTAMAGTLVLHHRFNPRRVIRLIEEYQPTVLHAVPAMLVALNDQLRRRAANLRSVKWVISGGSTLDTGVAREFAHYSGALVVEGYGLSEASPVTHVGPLDQAARPGTIGWPLPDTECRIVDPHDPDHDVPAGEVGELLVRGPQVMLGYWQNPEATAAVIHDGWLRTGDLASVDQEGFYRIVDRHKDLIITSGFNVYPGEVERVLRDNPLVKDAAVVGVPDAARGEVVKAVVVLQKGARWNEHTLRRYCRQHLAAHKRPRVFEQADGDLPRNFLGKVLRRHVRDGTTGAPETTTASEPSAELDPRLAYATYSTAVDVDKEIPR